MRLFSKNKQIKDPNSKEAKDKEVRDFIRELIKKGIVEISPYLDIEGIRYPEAEEYIKDHDYTKMTDNLESLVAQGVLKEIESTRIITCPNCNSPGVFSKFTCPKCGSEAVELTQLLEHKECGYIGSRKEFIKDGEMVCPRCGTKLSKEGVDYRSIGNFYQCEKCLNRFDKPEVIHVCQKCGKVSTYQDVKYKKVGSFRVSDEVLSELTSEFPVIEKIGLFLENKGFKVRLHDAITGVSGTESKFALIAEKENIRIVSDVSIEGKKGDIIAFLTKKIDVSPTKAVLLDFSGSNELTNLGKIYDIDVIGVNVTGSRVEKTVPIEFERLIESLSKQSRT